MISPVSLGLSNTDMLLGLTAVTNTPTSPSLDVEQQLLGDMGYGAGSASTGSSLDSVLSEYEGALAGLPPSSTSQAASLDSVLSEYETYLSDPTGATLPSASSPAAGTLLDLSA